MIRGYVFGGEELVKNLHAIGPRLSARLMTFIKLTVIKLQRHVKQDKLTGQVLHVRSGTLRRSITSKVKQSSTGVYGIVGTNVVYGAVHEFGFSGRQNVKAHLRKVKQAFGRQIKERQVAVRAFTREVKLPERSFLRSALKDMRPEIREGLQREVRASLGGLLK